MVRTVKGPATKDLVTVATFSSDRPPVTSLGPGLVGVGMHL